MKFIQKSIILLFLYFASNVYAEDTIKSIFGLVPGDESPLPNNSEHTPFNISRIPIISSNFAKVFPDVQMFALKDSNTIIGFVGRRAYDSFSSCEKAKNTVLNTLKKIFSEKYSGDYPKWEYLSKDGNMAMGITCFEYVGNPYPMLEMELSHIKSHEIYYEQLKSLR